MEYATQINKDKTKIIRYFNKKLTVTHLLSKNINNK